MAITNSLKQFGADMQKANREMAISDSNNNVEMAHALSNVFAGFKADEGNARSNLSRITESAARPAPSKRTKARAGALEARLRPFAKLGETQAQVRQRHGEPVDTNPFKGLPLLAFVQDGITLKVIFFNGASAHEVISWETGTKPFSDEESVAAFTALSGASEWTRTDDFAPPDVKWHSAKGFVGIRTRSSDGSESLSVLTDEFFNRSYGESAKKSETPATTSTGPSATDIAAFKFHLQQARAGNVGSQLRVAQFYLEGKGCAANTNEAKIWLQKAADQGDGDAKQMLQDLQ